MKFVKTVALAALIAVLAVVVYFGSTHTGSLVGDVHEHADFAVYLHGAQENYAQPQFMSTENKTVSSFVHLHDNEGRMIHKHSTGITLGFFFETLGLEFENSCFNIADDKHCPVRTFVKSQGSDWREVNGENYEFRDLDRILITDATDVNIIKTQQEYVSDEACIYSGKCPERGLPPPEASCVTGEECVA